MTAVVCMTPPTTGTLTVVTMGVTVGLSGDQPPAHSRAQRLNLDQCYLCRRDDPMAVANLNRSYCQDIASPRLYDRGMATIKESRLC
jgi:hypothetical protein